MLHVQAANVQAFEFGGLRITDLTAGTGAAGSLAVVEVPAGSGHARARSTRSEKLYLCLVGKAQFRVGAADVTLTSGDLLVVERGEWFSYRNTDSETARLLLVHVPPFELASEEFAGDNEPV